jgi:hypothetical protein
MITPLIAMWDVVDAFVDIMCLGDVLTFDGASISLGGRWVRINCPADGECEVRSTSHNPSKLMTTYCKLWRDSDLYAVTKSIIQRLKRRYVDPASITLTLDLSPAQPWKQPVQWSLKDFDNAKLVVKHDIYEIEISSLNKPKAVFKILGAQIIQYNLGQAKPQSQTQEITLLLNRLFRKYKPHTRRKQTQNPLTIIQRVIRQQLQQQTNNT